MGGLKATLFFLPLHLAAAACMLSFLNPLVDNTIPHPGPAIAQAVKQPEYVDTAYGGTWQLVSENAGVSAMHMAVNHNNKAIMFDDTNLGPSMIQLPPGKCCPVPGAKPDEVDCFAHAIEFDPDTANIRTLRVLKDTWCSSGGFGVDGTLVQTSRWNDGERTVRYIGACDTCDWMEYPTDLSGMRWYATQQTLPNGAHVVMGGRWMFNYEYVPPPGKGNRAARLLPFLNETTDQLENNLYPFVHLNTDGNLFLFANDRAILFDHDTGNVVKRYPPLRGGARNYPASGMSALLPIVLHNQAAYLDFVNRTEVIVCGGGNPEAFQLAENGSFPPAIRSCGRILVNHPSPKWRMEQMPVPRTVGDMLVLPNGELLVINGASKGCAGWDFARDPVLTPVLYRPDAAPAVRFKTLGATTIPRMYHSTSAVLPDASIFVAGSNTNGVYKFENVMYPTELRVEKFYPPYFDPALAGDRPTVKENSLPEIVKYGKQYDIVFGVSTGYRDVWAENVKVTMYAPPFTTHGFSMNQRLLVLKMEGLSPRTGSRYKVTVTMPPSGKVAPPGYYMVFVVHRGVPSKAVWARIS